MVLAGLRFFPKLSLGLPWPAMALRKTAPTLFSRYQEFLSLSILYPLISSDSETNQFNLPHIIEVLITTIENIENIEVSRFWSSLYLI